ncbi:hypothetical protein [Paenibacillus harenae]|uniref:Subtilisin-like proprotein convertase family protein n=1 Tax=Paenibacillus harenae TaxID=306543 RepID=A0ABT9TYV7_PAEHA|nr:hypothetical protein [Paenibacillus harenae]MDQ0112564.1 subtilisin-like proprotein convertase family protein [Paenibacillus harenae]
MGCPTKKKRRCRKKTIIVCKKKSKKKRRVIVINVDPTPVSVNPTINVDPTPVNVNPIINVDPTLTIGPFQRVCNSTVSTTATFTNTDPITVPAAGIADPYPSTIAVTGMTGTIAKVTVTLFNMNHAFQDDLDILLVHPDGVTNTLLMSDAGGSSPLVDVTLTFDDDATSFLPDAGQIVSGTFKPTNYGPLENLPAPAPPSSPFVRLSNFIGLNPNGPWSLFAVDDAAGGAGNISGGWSLTITTDTEVCTFTPL